MDEERSTQGAVDETPPVRTSGLAIASLVLAVTCIGSPIAIILGIIALVQMARNPPLRGQGLAIAGIIVGAFFMFFSLVMAAIMFPVFYRARETAQKTACMNNLKQLNTAMQMYALDHSDRFPPASGWNGTLRPYYKNPRVLVCPSVKGKQPSYGMNDRIAGIVTKDVISPAYVVSLFDSVPGLNQSGGRELLPSPPRHIYETNNIGFADGHVQSVSDPKTLNWDPKALP